MYGVITTVPAPVEMYDKMHAELIRRAGPSVEGLLVHVGGATGVQGALRPRQHRHPLSPDAGAGRRSAHAFDRANNTSLRRPWACHPQRQHPDLTEMRTSLKTDASCRSARRVGLSCASGVTF